METRKKLIAKYHVICNQLGITEDERKEMLSAYNVTSSADMSIRDLVDICFKLYSKNYKVEKKDKLRKRTIAAIGNYLRFTGDDGSMQIIKGIACRITKHDNFNKIPSERLRNLIYLFNNKVKDIKSLRKINKINIKENSIEN